MAGSEHTLLIVGGTARHPGGIEAFCERSAIALRRHGHWDITIEPADSAYLRVGDLFRFARALARLWRYRRAKPDHVWVQYGNMPDLAYLVVAKLLGFKVMVTPHLGSNWRSQSNPALRKISGLLLRLPDRLALISRTQEQEIAIEGDVPRSLIRNFLPEKILGLNLEDGRQPPNTLQIIHSGRLSEGKGTFLVIEVCARLRDAGVPFHARITGGAEPETFDRLHALIAEHRLEGQVEVLGRIPEDDLLDLLRQSDVLLHLSRIDSYPLIVLEAMACSVLPVCMELAGARDQVETYGGHVVSVAHPVEEAAAWLAAQDLDHIRAMAHEAAIGVRRDYSWERCAGALEDALLACSNRAPVTVSGSLGAG